MWCTKVRIGVRQNKIPLQTLIDEIEKQLTTTWTVNFVDSKPYYKTLVILPYAVHCACVLWGAVCKMQKQHAGEVCGTLKLGSVLGRQKSHFSDEIEKQSIM